jgi:hypothetical protein
MRNSLGSAGPDNPSPRRNIDGIDWFAGEAGTSQGANAWDVACASPA